MAAPRLKVRPTALSQAPCTGFTSMHYWTVWRFPKWLAERNRKTFHRETSPAPHENRLFAFVFLPVCRLQYHSQKPAAEGNEPARGFAHWAPHASLHPP